MQCTRNACWCDILTTHCEMLSDQQPWRTRKSKQHAVQASQSAVVDSSISDSSWKHLSISHTKLLVSLVASVAYASSAKSFALAMTTRKNLRSEVSAIRRTPNFKPDEPSCRSEPVYMWERGASAVHGDANGDAVGYSDSCHAPAPQENPHRRPQPVQALQKKGLRKQQVSLTLGPMQTSSHP